MYLFTNITGVFIFDNQLNVIDKILFKDSKEYKNKAEFIQKIKEKHKSLKEPGDADMEKLLLFFKSKSFSRAFCDNNLQLTKSCIKKSASPDAMLIQATNSIDETDKIINLLARRLREWYELYNPEFSRATQSHEKFVEDILGKEKIELLAGIGADAEDSMGADLGQKDIEPIKSLAQQVHGLYQLRNIQESYISSLMQDLCPNAKAVCGTLICAKLIGRAGSLKRLSEMPASTIQVLGAENALFRHMKTGAKPPRHGILVHHPLVAKAPDRMHGKIARALADKISIASKIDYFRGEFIGDKLREHLDKKFSAKGNFEKSA